MGHWIKTEGTDPVCQGVGEWAQTGHRTPWVDRSGQRAVVEGERAKRGKHQITRGLGRPPWGLYHSVFTRVKWGSSHHGAVGWELDCSGSSHWIQSPALHRGLKVQCCCRCGIGCSCDLDSIPGPGTSYATSAAMKDKEGKRESEMGMAGGFGAGELHAWSDLLYKWIILSALLRIDWSGAALGEMVVAWIRMEVAELVRPDQIQDPFRGIRRICWHFGHGL